MWKIFEISFLRFARPKFKSYVTLVRFLIFQRKYSPPPLPPQVNSDNFESYIKSCVKMSP